MPARGEAFSDARGDARALRASWHGEAGVLVLSLWRGNRCVATHQLPTSDVPRLVQVLVEGLASAVTPASERQHDDVG